MDVYIGNLPGQMYETELLGLLKQVHKSSKTELRSPIHKHAEQGYYCIAHISKDKSAKRFIKKYNNKSPYGHLLKIREYIHRCSGNERRMLNWRTQKWEGIEKRKTERRAFTAHTPLQ